MRREAAALWREWSALLRGNAAASELPGALQLTLDDAAVAERERRREAETGFLARSPWISRTIYRLGCRSLDAWFGGRPVARFWLLETVARMPYFSYLTVLHLYETLNWLHVADLRRVHFAEEWNELHHLLIMSALGGDARWVDRFLAYHLSLLYYWMLVVVYMISPATSYNFSELLEKHAHDTYAEFVEQNAARLRMLPAPEVAVQYYREGDLYAFAPIAQGQTAPARRPPVESLYDVFVNVRDDEAEHVKTMEACQRDDFVTSHTEMPTPYVSRREASSNSPTTPQGDVVHLTDAPYRIRVEEDRQRWKHWIDETGRYANARIDEGQQRHEPRHRASHGEHADTQRTAADLPDYEDGLGL